jgi:hypothetical protein
MNKMLNPCIVGIVYRRGAVFPASILFESLPAPVAHIKRGIGKEKVGPQILMKIVVKTICISAMSPGKDGQMWYNWDAYDFMLFSYI